jgi:hypothetical protein
MADGQGACVSPDSWYSTCCGLVDGRDSFFGNGLAPGFGPALTSSRFEGDGCQDADGSAKELLLGVHGAYVPDFRERTACPAPCPSASMQSSCNARSTPAPGAIF